MKNLFTSESVTEGHPDKICDQISDAILDSILAEDPQARVACETAITTGAVFVLGEITTKAYVDIENIVRKTISDIGYNDPQYGFDANTCAVITTIKGQSPDIALGVNKSFEAQHGSTDKVLGTGAGDQGMMFGYACDETENYMPTPIDLAHKLTKKLTEVRKKGQLPYLGPDGKSQVTVEYDGEGVPMRVDTVLISTQHSPDVEMAKLVEDITEQVIKTTIPVHLIDSNTKIYINPTGRFVIGGPQGDTGLTGRKIIVDTYGGFSRHGGGAFSGKDPTKVDRSASYAARHIAKNLVAAGAALKCEIQLSYAIGMAQPISILVDTFGTGIISDDQLADLVYKVFDLRPEAITANLNLRRPLYQQTAAYGHFGRDDIDLPWEKLDKVDDITKRLNRE